MAHSIEIVDGGLSPDAEGEVLRFWLAHGVLDERAGRERLPAVVALVRDEAGALAGTGSAVATEVGVVGGRRFSVLRSFLAPGAAADRSLPAALEREVFASLHAASTGDPVGLCLLLTPAEAAERPDAQWSDPPFVYAGHLPDGRQVRVAYFEPVSIEPGVPPLTAAPVWDRDVGPRLAVFREQDDVSPDEVAAFWIREGAVPEEEARRRVDEVLVVAIADDGDIAGVTTAYLAFNEQLGADVWHLRVFVAKAHRGQAFGLGLVIVAREELGRRWASGKDRRAPGILMEITNPFLRRTGPNAWWTPHAFWFVGENARGDHLRVHWFPGAPAPAPGAVAQGST